VAKVQKARELKRWLTSQLTIYCRKNLSIATVTMAAVVRARAALASKSQQKKLEALKTAQKSFDILDDGQRDHVMELLDLEMSTQFISDLWKGNILGSISHAHNGSLPSRLTSISLQLNYSINLSTR